MARTKREPDDESDTVETAAEHVAAGTWVELLEQLRIRIDELAARVEKLEAKA